MSFPTTGLTSGGVRIYPCSVCGSLEDLVATAEGQLTRDLAPEERATYLGESAEG